MTRVEDRDSKRAEVVKSEISENTFQTVFENAFFGMVLVGTDGPLSKQTKRRALYSVIHKMSY